MKKFYAILLSIALVPGFATVAGAADLTVTGEFEATGLIDNDGWQGLGWDAGTLTIKVAGKMGDNATADLSLAYDQTYSEVYPVVDDTGTPVPGSFYTEPRIWISGANFTYNLTEQFFIGYQYAERVDGNGYRLYKGGDYCFADTINNIYFAEHGVVKAGYKFDGGEVTIYSDLYPDDMYFYAKGSYAADPLIITAWLASEDALTFVAAVDYEISDALNVTGFFGDMDGGFVLGAKAKYVVEDMVTVEGRLEYALDETDWVGMTDALYDYNVKATFTALGETFQPYAYYDDDDELGVGFDYYLGDSDFWAEYSSADEALSLGLDLVF